MDLRRLSASGLACHFHPRGNLVDGGHPEIMSHSLSPDYSTWVGGGSIKVVVE
ncbi:hypothetical protein CEXT_351591, partial [Caerostris extrusa]